MDMESSTFDDQIFGDFAGPLSPLGVKAHSVQVMLGMPSGGGVGGNGSPNSSSGGAGSSGDLCHQRLPEVHSLLPGAPKMDHYKTLDYTGTKIIDYKLEAYGSPTAKYDYLGTASSSSSLSPTKQLLDYGSSSCSGGKQMDYSGLTSIAIKHHHMDYAPHSPQPPTAMMVVQQQSGQSHLQSAKLSDYDHQQLQMFQHQHQQHHQLQQHPQHQHQQQQHLQHLHQHQQQQTVQTIDMTTGTSSNSGTPSSGSNATTNLDMNGLKKKPEDMSCSSTTTTSNSSSSASSSANASANASATGAADSNGGAAGKKNDKKKTDSNGTKKKKTR